MKMEFPIYYRGGFTFEWFPYSDVYGTWSLQIRVWKRGIELRGSK